MKVSVLFLALLSCVVWSMNPAAKATAEQASYNGAVYPYFQAITNGEIFCTGYSNYASLFTSKRDIYRIKLDALSAEKLFSVRNNNSTVFVDNESLYFTYPDSFINTQLVYGSYTWYTSTIEDSGNKRCWKELSSSRAETSTEWDISYFQTVDGLYCKMNPKNGYGYCRLLQILDGNPIVLFEAEDARLSQGHSLVVISTANGLEMQQLTVYDVCGKRTITVPYSEAWLPEMLIAGDRVYYTDNDRVLCYNISSSDVTTIYEHSPKHNAYLCYDDGKLYIIDMNMVNSDDLIVSVYSAINGQYIRSIDIPKPKAAGEFIVKAGKLFYGREASGEIVLYDLTTKESLTIPLQ